ncbi:MAG: hypothetical protein QF460_03540, partial [Candidatus Nanoarchaeia archaeon]|nr:hypothetical protein [Candidatus Nanoarchaeia archaeon]
ARTDIISENECISGGLNSAALLNPNLQEAAQEAIDPAIYNRGVVRICATSNPGTGTDPTRFTEMGYCDDERVKCWLDGESVDNAITTANTGMRENVSETLEGIQTAQSVFSDEFNLIEGKTVNQKSEELNNKIAQVLKAISPGAVAELAEEFDKVIDSAGLNSIKAMFMLMKGDFYEQVFRKSVYPKIAAVVDKPAEEESDEEEVDGEEGEEEVEEETSNEEDSSAGQEGESYYHFGEVSSEINVGNFTYNLLKCGEDSQGIYFADSGPKLIYVDIEHDGVLNSNERIGNFESNN